MRYGENIKRGAIGLGKGLLCGTAIILTALVEVESAKSYSEPNYNGYGANKSEGYDKAVGAIMSSDMWSSDKQRAVGVLRQYANKEYYSAVIQVVNSDMWSSSKLETIKSMS